MAALTANTTVVQTLRETESLLVVRFMYHENVGGGESSVLKINVETLFARTIQLTVANSNVLFLPGRQVTGNNTGAIGYVTGINTSTANAIIVTETTGTFTASDFIIGADNTATQISTVTTPARALEIVSLEWAVFGSGANATMSVGKVGIEFANSTAFYTAAMLTGTGYMGRNHLGGMRLAPPATLTSPNGNIYISTYDLPALNGGYDIIAEIRKTAGFAQRPTY